MIFEYITIQDMPIQNNQLPALLMQVTFDFQYLINVPISS